MGVKYFSKETYTLAKAIEVVKSIIPNAFITEVDGKSSFKIGDQGRVEVWEIKYKETTNVKEY